MLKMVDGVRLIRFEPEFHTAKLYEWYYASHYDEFFRDFPECPSAMELAKLAQGRAFVVTKDDIVVGFIVYGGVNEVSRNFEVSVLIDTEGQSQKIALNGLKIFLDWMFNARNFYKAKLKVLAENKRVCELVEKFGANRDGVLKKDIFFKSKFHDIAAYAIFKTDFNKLYLKEFEPRLESPDLEILKRSA